LAKLLDRNSVISLLDLADNHLHADSGRALARALGHSRALCSLNLRLNRLGDEGCAALCDALARSQAPAARAAYAGSSAGGSSSTAGSNGQQQQQQMAPLERLNLSSNGAGVGLLPSLCSMLRGNKGLSELDVSSNSFSEHVAQELVSAVSSSALLGLDVRGCGLGATAEAAISEEMLGRLAKIERKRLLGA
jgi:Ran GTPase-activating protein (RanGAP) involved in mRNA processing and transport